MIYDNGLTECDICGTTATTGSDKISRCETCARDLCRLCAEQWIDQYCSECYEKLSDGDPEAFPPLDKKTLGDLTTTGKSCNTRTRSKGE